MVSFGTARRCAWIAAAAFISSVVPTARAADLPAPTAAALAKLHIDSSWLKGLDAELAVPQAWVDAARKEGTLKVLGTWDNGQLDEMLKIFAERYPGIRVTYAKASRYDRSIKPLIALREGRYGADIITSFGRSYQQLRKMNGMADLRVLPNFKLLPPGLRDADGFWVGTKLSYRCIGYNTGRVKEADLPKTWEDLLTSPRWRNKHLGVTNSATNWLLNLWGVKGEAWTRNYIDRLFGEVQPQLRKEGSNASLGLAIAGEYDAVLVATAYRTREQALKGAPIGWHCPDIVPAAVSQAALLRGSPRTHAGLVFMNWMLSREAQIVNFAVSGQLPTHKDLLRRPFLHFPDQIEGKKIAYDGFPGYDEAEDKLLKYWAAAWEKGAGDKALKVKSPLVKVGSRGRDVQFRNGAQMQRARLSGSRTVITIDGKHASRPDLKDGMLCDITYEGDGKEARALTCTTK